MAAASDSCIRRRHAYRYRRKTAQATRLPLQHVALRFSEAQRANQSPPLMPTQAKNTEQATRDRGGLGNDRAIYLDVIELELEIEAIGRPPVNNFAGRDCLC